ncbi:MAG: GNAT family N-acetyltransferase, partial [Chloroflexota bacterium]
LSDKFLAQETINMRRLFLPKSQTWVYENDKRIAGFIYLLDNVVGGIFVHPDWQRKGVGKLLMDQACSVHDTLELEMFKANSQAIAFYNKYGFRVTSERHDEATNQPMLKLSYKKGEQANGPFLERFNP